MHSCHIYYDEPSPHLYSMYMKPNWSYTLLTLVAHSYVLLSHLLWRAISPFVFHVHETKLESHALNSSRPFLCTHVTSIMTSHLLICIPCTWNQMHVDYKSCRNKGTSTPKVMWHDLGIRPLVAHYSKYSSTTKKKSSASGLVWSQFLQKQQWEVGWMQFIVLGKEPVFSYFCVYCKSAVQTAMLFRV